MFGRKLFQALGSVVCTLVISSHGHAQTAAIAPYDNRPIIENTIVEARLNTLLPRLMREAGIDCGS